MARETWASRFGFIMATAGFAVGLGNIWRFPYTTGMNGGGAFLLSYLLFSLLIGIPLISAEIGLGRRAQLTPIAGMRHLTGSFWSPWNLFGWLGCCAALLILSYYTMLIGWILGYFAMVASGDFTGMSADAVSARYTEFTSTPGPVLAWTLSAIALLAFVVSRGLRGGLERLARTAMPLLFVLLLGLAIRSLTFPGAVRGLEWYLYPDFSAVSATTVLAALGQAFYSIGIGMAAAFGFGSYLSAEKSDVPGNAAIVVGFDTLCAFLAGLVIFPALFAFNLPPDAGPGLLFVTMTTLFAQMPAGQFFGTIFFFLLILAAFTSAVALHEVLTTSITDAGRLRRQAASWLLGGLVAVLAVPVVLSQGPWSHIRVQGMDLFALADNSATYFLLPAGALLLSLYTALAWGFDGFRNDVNRGAGRFRVGAAWRPLIVVVIPVAVALVLLAGLGLI